MRYTTTRMSSLSVKALRLFVGVVPTEQQDTQWMNTNGIKTTTGSGSGFFCKFLFKIVN
jgi:hypothetical protein